VLVVSGNSSHFWQEQIDSGRQWKDLVQYHFNRAALQCEALLFFQEGGGCLSQADITSLISDAVMTILVVSLPMLGMGLAVGLLISVLQATTQINEQTIVFVSKILCVFLSLIIFGRWMLDKLSDFTLRVFAMILG
jgi:flagellar biosynthetic protein FliQ